MGNVVMGRQNSQSGFTLVEVLAVISIIAVLAVLGGFASINQIAKARDARRKDDLNKIQKVLEQYNSDTRFYPPYTELPQTICNQPLQPYIVNLPCDPKNTGNFKYFYQTDATRKTYHLYTRLENTSDPEIAHTCGGGCDVYNYQVTSPNI